MSINKWFSGETSDRYKSVADPSLVGRVCGSPEVSAWDCGYLVALGKTGVWKSARLLRSILRKHNGTSCATVHLSSSDVWRRLLPPPSELECGSEPVFYLHQSIFFYIGPVFSKDTRPDFKCNNSLISRLMRSDHTGIREHSLCKEWK